MRDNWQKHIALCEHIIKCVAEIKLFTQGIGYTEFVDNRLVYQATTRSLETMADAVKQMKKDFEEHYPDLMWNEIAGFRNILVHEYLGDNIDNEIIWEIIQYHLNEVHKTFSDILNKLCKKHL